MKIGTEIDNAAKDIDLKDYSPEVQQQIKADNDRKKKIAKMLTATRKAAGIPEKDIEKGFTGRTSKEIKNDNLKKMHLSEDLLEQDIMYEPDQAPQFKVGDKVIINYCDFNPNLSGKSGVITRVDSLGQLYGTWGNDTLDPSEDDIERSSEDITEAEQHKLTRNRFTESLADYKRFVAACKQLGIDLEDPTQEESLDEDLQSEIEHRNNVYSNKDDIALSDFDRQAAEAKKKRALDKKKEAEAKIAKQQAANEAEKARIEKQAREEVQAKYQTEFNKLAKKKDRHDAAATWLRGINQKPSLSGAVSDIFDKYNSDKITNAKVDTSKESKPKRYRLQYTDPKNKAKDPNFKKRTLRTNRFYVDESLLLDEEVSMSATSPEQLAKNFERLGISMPKPKTIESNDFKVLSDEEGKDAIKVDSEIVKDLPAIESTYNIDDDKFKWRSNKQQQQGNKKESSDHLDSAGILDKEKIAKAAAEKEEKIQQDKLTKEKEKAYTNTGKTIKNIARAVDSTISRASKFPSSMKNAIKAGGAIKTKY